MRHRLAFFLMIAVILWLPQTVFAQPETINYQVDRDYPPFSYTTDSSLYGFDPYLTISFLIPMCIHSTILPIPGTRSIQG
jgi:hypothetical protein